MRPDNASRRRLTALAIVAVVLAGMMPVAARAQALDAAPDPFALNKRLGRGINLGDALDAPAEGKWGVALEERYFELIAQAGFTSVRIPARWSAHCSPEPPYEIDAAFAGRVNWAIDMALARGLAVVVDIHHFNELTEDPAGEKARFLSLSRQIALLLKDRPAEVIHELYNEPHDKLTPELWNAYLAEAVAAIREVAPHRTLMIGTANWGGVGALPSLRLPEGERNAIVTYHYYEPFHFTHQGAEWVPGSADWLGETWRATEEQQAKVREDFDKAAAWAAAQGVPLHMGEFGAYRRADQASREAWTRFVTREAEAREIAWSYWEFCSGFGAYDREAGTWRPWLLEALVPPKGEKVTDSRR